MTGALQLKLLCLVSLYNYFIMSAYWITGYINMTTWQLSATCSLSTSSPNILNQQKFICFFCSLLIEYTACGFSC